jgi:probable rRNA maturation factor
MPMPSRSVAREISIANRHPRLRIDRRAICAGIRLLDAQFATASNKGSSRAKPVLSCPPGELSLVFMTDEALAALHGDFLDDPTITDVITFEGDPTLGSAGEICVSADAALRQTSGRRKSTKAKSQAAFSTEVMLYVVHGWLHLAGYDDLQPAKKRIMRRAEERAMQLLSVANCVPHFSLR